jgi:predicted acylesterase/phospholipase RssA
VSGKRTAVAVCLLGLGLCAWAQQPAREPVVVEPPVRIGLALSGGAALGLAHIGVLKVLERESIPVVAISGNSMGSMVGGVYAAGYSVAEIESLALNLDWNRLFSSSVPFGAQYLPERQQAQRYFVQLRHKNLFPSLPSGLVPLQNVELLLMRLLADIEYNTGYDFDSLPIRYRAVAVDLKSAGLQVMGKGRLDQAIRASIAIPGVFAPERLGDMELVDGGVQQYLPVDPLDSMGLNLDFKIAVLTMKHNSETGVSLIDIASRSMDLVSPDDLRRQKQLADVLIEPNVDPFTHSDFAKAAGLIAAGESAAVAALPRIRELIGARRPLRPRHSVAVRQPCVVRAIRFEGLHVTREGTVRKELLTRPGDCLQFSRLIDDLTRLFNTGLFEDVNYRLEPAGGDSVDVIVDVQERAYGFYSLGIRYDNADNLGLGFEVGQGNLGGTGASVRAALDLGNPNEIRLGLTGTRLFRLPFGYRLDGFLGSAGRDYYDSSQWQGTYTVGYRGGVAEAGYILGRDAFFDFGLRGYQAAYRVPYGFPKDSVRADHSEWIVGPSFRLETNTFRDVDFPTAGAASRFEALSSATMQKGTHQFLRLGYSAQRVIPVSSRLLLRPALDVGVSFGELAWAEQFRTGSAGFVGFEPDGFTSAQRAVAKFGADFRLFRLFGQENSPVYLQVMGNVGTFAPWGDLLTISGLPSLLHWGAGAGARTNTPIGPVQLIVGVGDFGGKLPEQRTALAVLFSVGREFRYTR